ncbi:hypothetical protein Vretifemale_1714 [Volvox reticuliferus]|nr:hypothetical protein Vretifemale_1714 [Volvox reticuliferus]
MNQFIAPKPVDSQLIDAVHLPNPPISADGYDTRTRKSSTSPRRPLAGQIQLPWPRACCRKAPTSKKASGLAAAMAPKCAGAVTSPPCSGQRSDTVTGPELTAPSASASVSAAPLAPCGVVAGGAGASSPEAVVARSLPPASSRPPTYVCTRATACGSGSGGAKLRRRSSSERGSHSRNTATAPATPSGHSSVRRLAPRTKPPERSTAWSACGNRGRDGE